MPEGLISGSPDFLGEERVAELRSLGSFSEGERPVDVPMFSIEAETREIGTCLGLVPGGEDLDLFFRRHSPPLPDRAKI